MVVGLVTVKKKVEIKLLKSPLLSRFAAFDAGLATKNLIPKKSKNNPPINFIQNSCVKRNEEIAVSPKACDYAVNCVCHCRSHSGNKT